MANKKRQQTINKRNRERAVEERRTLKREMKRERKQAAAAERAAERDGEQAPAAPVDGAGDEQQDYAELDPPESAVERRPT